MRKYILILTCVLFSGLVLTSCGRTDFEIQGDVRNAIIFTNPKVEINVRNGIVNLSGFVDSEENKVSSEKMAAGIKGVKSVNNSIEVWIPEPVITADQSLTTAITEVLKKEKLEGIEVSVIDEVVTLTGKVSKANQRKVMEMMRGIKTKKVVNEMK